MSFFPVKVQTMRVSTSPRGILDLILLSPPLATDAIRWGIEKEPVVKKTCHDIMKTFHRNFRLCEVWFVINMKVVSTAIVPYVRLCKSRWMLHNLFFFMPQWPCAKGYSSCDNTVAGHHIELLWQRVSSSHTHWHHACSLPESIGTRTVPYG